MTPSKKHSLTEDVQGIGLGIFFCALSLQFLTFSGLITGQTAGIAVLLSYVSGWSFGAVFFVINIPFYVLAWMRLGPQFTVKSIMSVTTLSVVTEYLPQGFQIAAVATPLSAVIAGALSGVGLLVMFRHNGSLGGLGVLALLLQDRFGWRAGYVQLVADAVIFGAALLVLPAMIVLWSLLGAVVLNIIIAINHRRDRYIAT